jgi:hypothetical protein
MIMSEKFQLQIEVDASRGNAAILGFNNNLSTIEQKAAQSARGMSGGMEQMSGSIREGREAAKLLEEQIGIRLPRAVNGFLARSQVLGPALQSMFHIGVYGAIAEGLISYVDRIGEKMEWWGGKIDDAKKHNEELTKQIQEQNKVWDDYYDHLEKIRRERDLLGLSGSAAAGGKKQFTQEDVNKARSDYETLTAQSNALAFQLNRTKKYNVVGGDRQLTPEYIGVSNQAATAADKAREAERKWREETENLVTATKSLNQAQTEEAKKAAAERKKQEDDLLKQQIDVMHRRQENESSARWAKIELERDVAKTLSGIQEKQMAEDEQTWNAYWEKRKRDVENLRRENESLQISQLKGRKDYQGALSIELQQLETLKKQHADEPAYISEIEERKKLLIMGTNEQIAKDAKDQFERSASTIEGFINRVFLTAKSFSDVWHQLISQVANYAVSQFARMAAASRQAMTAASGQPAGAGAGGGLLGGLGSIFMPGMSSGGTPPFFQRATGAGGSGSASGSGLMGGSSGDGTIINLPLVGGGMLAMAGMKRGGTSGNLMTIGGGASMGYGMASTLGMTGAGGAIFGGGAGLMAAGLQRGGWSGVGMSTAGGALMGLQVAGPIGALVGAAIGFAAGMIRKFHKTAEEKARSKIKSTYGVDISDKGILQQIVEIAKQGFGSNLDMAIRSKQVEDLVRLYALTTGQNATGMRPQMTSSTLVQSSSGLYQATSYANGYAQSSSGSLPGASLDSIGAGVSSGGGVTIVSHIVIPLQEAFEKQTVTVISRNAKVIQNANTKASLQNYNRRELASLQLQPGSLMR